MTVAPDLDTVRGGSGDGPLVVLLHGMGGNSGAWSALLPWLSGRPWLAVDLPGHGRSPRLEAYSYARCAEAVAATLPARTDRDVVVLGHSFGGVVGLALAAVRPIAAVLTVGMRAVWPAEFVAALAALAAKPPRGFPDRAAATAFLLRVNGLDGLLDGADEFVARGITRLDGQWRLAQDPRAMGIPEPAFNLLFGAAVDAGTTVTVAHGEHDSMVAVGDYDRFVDRFGLTVSVLPGLGHNAHVEGPPAVAGLLPP